MPELDPTGGMGEKIIPLVRFPILMRVLLPGALATAFLYPLLVASYPELAVHLTLDFKGNWQQLVLISGMIFVFGALASALNGEVYKIYEGRILWPRRLLDAAVGKQQTRVESLLRDKDDAKEAGRQTQLAEVWYQLRLYPVDDEGKQYAQRPTLLGNILAGYEEYSDKRYGMDSVFFWPRLWLQMDKEKKQEIDSSWSVADGFLSLSAVSFLGGALWILMLAVNALGISALDLPLSWWGTLFAGIAFGALGYGFYRLSLPFHRQNGELFKSIFDLYRDKIWSMTSMKPNEIQAWDAAWSYLQYLQVPCKGKLDGGEKCDEWVVPTAEKCPKCKKPVPESLAELKDSGQFPHR